MHITVCICTRNRGARIDATLQSLLEQRYADFDVLVLDQSTDDATERATTPYTKSDARFSYVRLHTVGRNAALNHGVAHAAGPILVCTDDDCVVEPGWLATFARQFDANPDVGLISAPVLAAPHDPTAGMIPVAPITATLRIDSPWLFLRDHGIGANQAFRLDALHRVGPFDSQLGAGGPFASAEDIDMAYRLLRQRVPILNIAEGAVVHYGFRPNTEVKRHMEMVAYGLGAMYAKHLRSGDPAILPTFLNLYLRALVGASITSVVDRLPARLRRGLSTGRASWPRDLQRRLASLPPARYMTLGITHSFRYRVDRAQRLYTSAA